MQAGNLEKRSSRILIARLGVQKIELHGSYPTQVMGQGLTVTQCQLTHLNPQAAVSTIVQGVEFGQQDKHGETLRTVHPEAVQV